MLEISSFAGCDDKAARMVAVTPDEVAQSVRAREVEPGMAREKGRTERSRRTIPVND